MRKWHRWLSVLFGLFMLWIAVTGVLSHVGSLVNDARQVALAAAPAGFVCPETMNCRPKPAPGGWNLGLLHHLHSGETFGPIGTAIAILSGLTLIFFSISGLWMYLQMLRGRLVKAGGGKAVRGGKLFW
ncbi:PepSY domain-containing protein [Sphingomonas sp. GCM10030256]|uniref:PepSY domain-containing protein n=1 Tax=Sphingomonas sp. GCM10030256 TaxID=3273427 RepID=UPI0036166A76